MQNIDLPAFCFNLGKFIRGRFTKGAIRGNGVNVYAKKMSDDLTVFSFADIVIENRNLILDVANAIQEQMSKQALPHCVEIRDLKSHERLVLISRGWDPLPEMPYYVKKRLGGGVSEQLHDSAIP